MVAVKVNLSTPSQAKRAAATGADGVGLVRLEHIVFTLPQHPAAYLSSGRSDEYRDALVRGLTPILAAFADKPVWVRTLDAPTDELREMAGGDGEPREANPMLGWRGIRRDIEWREHLRVEGEALQVLWDAGHTNLGVMFPMVIAPEEIRVAKTLLKAAGMDTDAIPFGVMIETPAAALLIRDFISEGVSFVSFGTNDLTQLTLGVDRTQPEVQQLYDEGHPAVLKLMGQVIDACRAQGVESSVCGEAASEPELAVEFATLGITSLSVNLDAVDAIRAALRKADAAD